MPKKEYYKHILPHFQQPGQAYFVTWNLKDAIPPKAFFRYTRKLRELRNQIQFQTKQSAPADAINALKNDYQSVLKKYIQAYNQLLDQSNAPVLDLTNSENLTVVKESLHFWNNKKLENYAYCIMPNHVHWVFRTLPLDEEGSPVYLQDILYSVKRFSAAHINKRMNRTGAVWQEESFDTTIRDEVHLFRAIDYTLNNPVKAGFVEKWSNWKGCWFDGWGDI